MLLIYIIVLTESHNKKWLYWICLRLTYREEEKNFVRLNKRNISRTTAPL